MGGEPRVQYDRWYILLPPAASKGMARQVTDALWEQYRVTVGGSADDAGIGDLDDKHVIAVSPDEWGGDLEEFYQTYYPGTKYHTTEYNNYFQLQGRLRALMLRYRDGIVLQRPTTHDKRITDHFGRWREKGSYYHNGLDLASSWDKWRDVLLTAIGGKVIVAGYNENEPWYGYQVRTRTELPDGRVLLARYAHLKEDGVYVSVGDWVNAGDSLGRPGSTGESTGDHLHIDIKLEGAYLDPDVLIQWQDTKPVAVGMHDASGGSWMAANSIQGPCLVLDTVQTTAKNLDYRWLSSVGITVIGRISYGYQPSGTFPRPEKRDAFVQACADTINNARGVSYWHIGNEPNNRAEWPGFGTDNEYPLTKEYVLSIYKDIRNLVPLAKIGYPPLDPYYGPGSDNRTWWRHFLANAKTDVIFLHAKTQYNDPAMVWSEAKFSDDPLRWQYLNLRVVETALADNPYDVPVYVTELNPQRITDTQLGWDSQNTEWVHEAMDYIRTQPVDGVCFYRFINDDWALQYKPEILEAIKQEA